MMPGVAVLFPAAFEAVVGFKDEMLIIAPAQPEAQPPQVSWSEFVIVVAKARVAHQRIAVHRQNLAEPRGGIKVSSVNCCIAFAIIIIDVAICFWTVSLSRPIGVTAGAHAHSRFAIYIGVAFEKVRVKLGRG